MAKKSKGAVEYVWLQCTETGDLNYRTPDNAKGGTAAEVRRLVLTASGAPLPGRTRPEPALARVLGRILFG